MMNRMQLVAIVAAWSSLLVVVHGFTLNSPIRYNQHPSITSTSTSLHAAANGDNKRGTYDVRRRKELLSRNGPFFKLDRFSGKVEFGSSAKLVTKLDGKPNPDGIKEWLSDGQGLALSIWDEDLMKELGDSVYRLQIMKLQFVTIQLAPRVDVKMWTQTDDANGNPVFSLQSIDFDPNIQVLPGIGVPASALGVEIDVAGELRPTKDGTGVTGSVSFATKGLLPPPMRLLPEAALKGASDTINDSIVKLAVQSFQKGAIAKYRQYKQQKEREVVEA